ncbi:MAG: hypothetical protein CMP47_12460 [Rickettsiales bacterium]|nr:hypothetical protein [Rickettsiales bacterium]|tara:strand:+ start:864 stop:1124 length:261 start_codon:yes stop_codon:yes gene_type:complete
MKSQCNANCWFSIKVLDKACFAEIVKLFNRYCGPGKSNWTAGKVLTHLKYGTAHTANFYIYNIGADLSALGEELKRVSPSVALKTK